MSNIDTSGHDVSKVGIPVSGMSAMARRVAPIPTKAQLADPNFVLPGDYVRLGLRKSDGAPDWAESPAAPIELYEEGNEVSARTGTLEVTQIFAQDDATLREQVRGVAPENGVMDVDIDQQVECILYTEDLFLMPDGSYELERKIGPGAKVTAVAKAKNSRGDVTGTTVKWKVSRSAEIGGKHYREARVKADATPVPVIVAVTPSGQKIGDQIVIEGYNFEGATGVTIDGAAVVAPLFASAEAIVAKIPAGAVGVAPIIVTTPNGPSAAVDYTVSA